MGSQQECAAARSEAVAAAKEVVEKLAAVPEETPKTCERAGKLDSCKEPATKDGPKTGVAESDVSELPKAQARLCSKVITDAATDEPINVSNVVKKLDYDDSIDKDASVADKVGVLDAGKKIVEADKDIHDQLEDQLEDQPEDQLEDQPAKKQKIAAEVNAPASVDPVA